MWMEEPCAASASHRWQMVPVCAFSTDWSPGHPSSWLKSSKHKEKNPRNTLIKARAMHTQPAPLPKLLTFDVLNLNPKLLIDGYISGIMFKVRLWRNEVLHPPAGTNDEATFQQSFSQYLFYDHHYSFQLTQPFYAAFLQYNSSFIISFHLGLHRA